MYIPKYDRIWTWEERYKRIMIGATYNPNYDENSEWNPGS